MLALESAVVKAVLVWIFKGSTSLDRYCDFGYVLTLHVGLIIYARRRVMAIDPVCKMTVDEKTAAATSEYKGKTYYFCAIGCKKAFDNDPEEYLKDQA